MKIFQIVMSLLILAALLVSGYVSWLTYKQMQKEELPPPVAKFEEFMQKYSTDPFEVQGWAKAGDEINLVRHVKPANVEDPIQDVLVFKQFTTSAGDQWFFNNQGTWLKVDTAPATK